MRPARKAELSQHLNQDLQDCCLFFIYRDKSDEVTAIPAEGLHNIKALEFGDEAPRGHLQAILTNLAFEQTVCQQSKHVDEQHGFNALVLVEIDRRDFQVMLGDLDSLLDTVFLSIQGQHLSRRQVPDIGDQ